MSIKTRLQPLKPTPKVAAQTSAGTVTGVITWLLVTGFFKNGLPVDLALALPGLVSVVWGFAAGWLKKENIVIPPLGGKELPAPAWLAELADALGPHSPEFIAEVSDPSNWLPLPPAGRLGATTVLFGEDSTSAASMGGGLDFYAGYGGFSSWSNMGSIHADFPGKKYLVYDTHVSGVDCYDIEQGGGSWSNAVAFFRQWKPVNLNKPAYYASASNFGGASVLAAAGIPRSAYYLIVAQWDGSPAIPPGFDAKQYASNNSYDSESAESYMWGAPAPTWPLALGSSGALVSTLQSNINKWVRALGGQFGSSVQLAVDGSFGPLTAAAVIAAQLYFNEGGTPGTCSQALYNDLARNPGPPPPPPPYGYKPVTGLTLIGAGPHSVNFQFQAVAQTSPGAAKFQVIVCKGDKIGAVIASYPRYIDFVTPGTYGQQYGGLEPSTGYVLAVRVLDQEGAHNSAWEVLHLQTAV